MRKKILFAVVVVMMLVLTAIPALAHGHGGSRAKAVVYSICPTESCTQTGQHYHNGRYYYAHYYGDGHNYHGYCTVEDCALSGYHSHDGSYHFGHTAYDGHGYHHTSTGRRHH